MPTRAQLRAAAFARMQQQNGGASPGATLRLSPLPSGDAISLATTPQDREEHHVIKVTGAIEEAFASIKCISGRVYVYSSVAAGVLADAAGACYIGRTPQFLTEVRAIGDQNLPYLINETSTGEPQPAKIYINGTAGDRLLLMYRPA